LLRSGRCDDVPLIRLEDGNHVTPWKDGKPQAFLPGPISTDFPTVSRAVYVTDGARALLTDLGLTKADPVDDVVRNVLPACRLDGSDAPQGLPGVIDRYGESVSVGGVAISLGASVPGQR